MVPPIKAAAASPVKAAAAKKPAAAVKPSATTPVKKVRSALIGTCAALSALPQARAHRSLQE